MLGPTCLFLGKKLEHGSVYCDTLQARLEAYVTAVDGVEDAGASGTRKSLNRKQICSMKLYSFFFFV